MLVFASVSHRAAPKRKTRSVSKGSKKSSTKKKTLTVQDEEKSSTSSEDPEKENADVQPKSAVRSTRAASKKGPPAVKVDDATPKEKPSLRQVSNVVFYFILFPKGHILRDSLPRHSSSSTIPRWLKMKC